MKKFYFLATTLLLLSSFTTINVVADVPPETGWADLDFLDTTGKTKELLPTYPIPQSAKWAENGYDRTFTMSAEEVDGEISYYIDTFTEEEEGTYTWDYTGVPASELPRNATYKLYYVIKNGKGTTVDTQQSVASVTLLPEPSVVLVLLVLGLSVLRRK